MKDANLRTFASHTLFPRESGSREDRDIQFVSFERLGSDGVVRTCPEELRASEVASWAQVKAWWGGGAYRAVGKDSRHCVVARFPLADMWVQLDGESRPFTPRESAFDLVEVRPEAPRLLPEEHVPAAVDERMRWKAPRLMGVTPEAIAHWVSACAEQAVHDAACTEGASQAFNDGRVIAYRSLAKRLLRMLAERSVGQASPPSRRCAPRSGR
jgi:hypothetical protein